MGRLMNMFGKRFWKRVLLWSVPLIVTFFVIWLAILMLGPQYENCWEAWTTWPNRYERLLNAFLPPSECMTLNEVGDFLAGSFAPLAFIWLAFAVVLQSLELSLQRGELELSRNVAEESKEAIRAQAEEARRSAEEARRSADYFNVQTKLMEAQKNREEREEANDELPGLCAQIRQAATTAFPAVNTSRTRHDYDVVREVAMVFLRQGHDLERLAFSFDYPDFPDMFVRLRELWPVLAQSAKIHLGMDRMEEFLCYDKAERSRPDDNGSETSSASSDLGAK